MRSDQLYLADVIEAIAAIDRFLEGIDQETFAASELHQSGILQKLIVIGEAVARVSKDLKGRHPAIPWRDIAGFRNIAVHEYFAVDWTIVWVTATRNVPLLRNRILEILRVESESGG